MWGVKTQSTKVCTAPFLETAPPGSHHSQHGSPKKQCCVRQLVGPQLGVSTAGQVCQSQGQQCLCRCHRAGCLLEGRGGGGKRGRCAPGSPPPVSSTTASGGKVWEPDCPEDPRWLRVGGCVASTAFLEFLPWVPREEITSRCDGWRGAGWRSLLRRCFGLMGFWQCVPLQISA